MCNGISWNDETKRQMMSMTAMFCPFYNKDAIVILQHSIGCKSILMWISWLNIID